MLCIGTLSFGLAPERSHPLKDAEVFLVALFVLSTSLLSDELLRSSLFLVLLDPFILLFVEWLCPGDSKIKKKRNS